MVKTVSVPKKGNESEVKETWITTFSVKFGLDDYKCRNDMSDEVLVTQICDKYAFLNTEINSEAIFSVTKSLISKRYTGTPKFPNVWIKCSPQITKHVMKDNDSYVDVGLSRCKSFDGFFVPQCYHCHKFNHFSGDYPDNDMPATCGKCAGSQKTKDCDRNSLEKCVYSTLNRERNFELNAFSPKCPAMVKASAFVSRKTDLDGQICRFR